MTDKIEKETVVQPMTPNEFLDTLVQRCFQDDPIFPVIDNGNPGIIVGGPKENHRGLYLITVKKISQATLNKLQELGKAPGPG